MRTKILSLIIGTSMAVSAEAGDHHNQSSSASAPAPAGRSAGSVARSTGFSGSGNYHFNPARFNGSSQRFSNFSARRNVLGPYSIRSGQADSFNQRRLAASNGRSTARQGDNFSALRRNGRTEAL